MRAQGCRLCFRNVVRISTRRSGRNDWRPSRPDRDQISILRGRKWLLLARNLITRCCGRQEAFDMIRAVRSNLQANRLEAGQLTDQLESQTPDTRRREKQTVSCFHLPTPCQNRRPPRRHLWPGLHRAASPVRVSPCIIHRHPTLQLLQRQRGVLTGELFSNDPVQDHVRQTGSGSADHVRHRSGAEPPRPPTSSRCCLPRRPRLLSNRTRIRTSLPFERKRTMRTRMMMRMTRTSGRVMECT